MTHDRLHALDGLRAAMMLLGLVLHTAVSYTVTDLGSAWPYKDMAMSPLADLAVRFIHLFRMPVFFVLAGFFAALLYARRGPGGLARNRLLRIGVPFVLGVLVLYPVVALGFVFAEAAQQGSRSAAWMFARELGSQPALYLPDSTLHLWFLYYLLWLYAGALLVTAVAARLSAATRAALHAGFRALVQRPVLRVAILGLVTAATLAPMHGVLNTDTSFILDPQVLLAYAVFFAFGWLLYAQRDLLPSLQRGAVLQATLAVLAFLALELFVAPRLEAADDWRDLYLARDLVDGLIVWLLFFGLSGLFMRHFDKPSPRTRYIVDASYWVYLVHMPCAIWIVGLLAPTGLGVWARMAVVLATITAIGFASYALFVRRSFIGLVLNGRRPPPVTSVTARTR